MVVGFCLISVCDLNVDCRKLNKVLIKFNNKIWSFYINIHKQLGQLYIGLIVVCRLSTPLFNDSTHQVDNASEFVIIKTILST